MSKTIELPDGTPHTFTDEEIERGEAMMARLREVEASLVDDTGQMTYFEMLLPCPFCGGRAWVQYWPYTDDMGYEARVVCGECHVSMVRECQGWKVSYMGDDLTRTLAMGRAISGWNRRSERTCRNASLDPLHFKCSECGADDYMSDSLTMWHEGGPVDIRYCPVCGARIVEVSE